MPQQTATQEQEQAQAQSTEDRQNLDPAVCDQLSALIITRAQEQLQLNAIQSRNQLTGILNQLTLNVQQINMASLKKLTKLGPLEAATTDNLLAAQNPERFAALNEAAGVPRGPQPRPATT